MMHFTFLGEHTQQTIPAQQQNFQQRRASESAGLITSELINKIFLQSGNSFKIWGMFTIWLNKEHGEWFAGTMIKTDYSITFFDYKGNLLKHIYIVDLIYAGGSMPDATPITLCTKDVVFGIKEISQ